MRTIILICFFSVFLVTFQIGFTQDKILNIELKNVSNPINLTISYQYTNFLDDDYYFNRDTTVKLLFNLMGEVNNKPLYTIKISDNNIFKVIYNYRDIRQSGLSVSIDFDSVYKSAEEINVLNKELYEEKYKLFSIDAENLNTEIDKKIKNKSMNKIGDILYDFDYITQP